MGHTDESTLGVIHKVRALRFRNFKPSLPLCTCTYAFSLHPLPPLVTCIFCELLSIKEPQATLQNKENSVQSYRRMSNQNTKKSPGIEFALFNCTEEMGMDNFGYVNSLFCFISTL